MAKGRKCNPKTCPILFGCFLERETMGSIANVMKARLLHWLKLGQEAKNSEAENE